MNDLGTDIELPVKMLPLTVKLLVALTCFTAMYLSTEAADTCRATTAYCIPGLPGRNGKDGQPGRDGRDGLPGPPGTLTYTEQQQLKENILEMFREEISMLSCNLPNPSTHQSLQCSGSSKDIPNPSIPPTAPQQIAQTLGLGQAIVTSSQPNNLITTSMTQPTLTPQPTPQPGPQCVGTTADNPAISCKEIYDCNPTAPSGYYWVNTTTGPLQVYCQMETNNCGNITGGWMRAAHIDMTNVSNTCPQGLSYTVAHSTRMCARSHGGVSDCSSVTFQTHKIPYTKVCGRALGYQYYAASGFHTVNQSTLDSYYASGLSVTHGFPRNHIWTFVAGYSKDDNYKYKENCPCTLYPGPSAPPFVGENYFCESGNTGRIEARQWYLGDPLWDSQGCASGSTCCDRGGPWFTTTLSQEVRDDIEVRMCVLHSYILENIGVQQLEILIY